MCLVPVPSRQVTAALKRPFTKVDQGSCDSKGSPKREPKWQHPCSTYGFLNPVEETHPLPPQFPDSYKSLDPNHPSPYATKRGLEGRASKGLPNVGEEETVWDRARLRVGLLL